MPSIASGTEPRCIGSVSPWASMRPRASHRAVEKSMLSLSTPECEVRTMVSAISSAIEPSEFRISSKWIGSTGMGFSALVVDADDNVAPGIEGRATVRRHNGGRVVFLDDEWAFKWAAGEAGAIEGGRLD